jgi:Ribonuclease G/E
MGGVYLGRISRDDGPIPGRVIDCGDFEALQPSGDRSRKLHRVGDKVVVQVTKDPREGKMIEVTEDVHLEGRFFVAAVNGVLRQRTSRRLTHKGEAERLRGIIERCSLPGTVIIRSSAGGRDDDTLLDDIDALDERAQAITGGQRCGMLLPAPDAAQRLWTSVGARVDRVVRDAATPARTGWPSTDETCDDLFDIDDMDATLRALTSKIAPWGDGGRLIIEPTSAFVAVDVDSGNTDGPVISRNVAACRALAEHIRLRNLGGQIVVDLLKMSKPKDSFRALQAIGDAVQDDPCHVRIAGFSRLGLLEMVRHRRGLALHETLALAGGWGR